MENKQVSIARHSYFYKVFFTKHSEVMSEFLNLRFTDLLKGYKTLIVFYGAYSYYLKDDDHDNHIKLRVLEEIKILRNHERYNYLEKKINYNGIVSFTFDELCEYNDLFHERLKDILEIFEIYCYNFAPSDMLPSLTKAHQEYERTLGFVIYDVFYECLYNIHAQIFSKMSDFQIEEFRDIIQMMMVFFYGYSYYIQMHTIKEIKNKFDKIFSLYNNEEFLRLFFAYIQGNINNNSLNKLQEYKDNLFYDCIDIFEMINQDLPKSNLMPKKAEKITIDDTLI